jgi:hypothetical protein
MFSKKQTPAQSLPAPQVAQTRRKAGSRSRRRVGRVGAWMTRSGLRMGKDECYLINPFVSYKHTINIYIYYNIYIYIIFPFRFPYWVFNFSICGYSKADCCILLYWLLPSPKYHISKKQTQNVQVSRYFYVIRCPSLWLFYVRGDHWEWVSILSIPLVTWGWTSTSTNGTGRFISKDTWSFHVSYTFPGLAQLVIMFSIKLHHQNLTRNPPNPQNASNYIKIPYPPINQQTGQLPDPISGGSIMKFQRSSLSVGPVGVTKLKL